MSGEEITFEDLLDADEPAPPATPGRPASYRELLEQGLPREGGLEALAAMTGIDDKDPRAAGLRKAYRQLLAVQLRGAR